MNNTIAGNELADTLELLFLDMNEGYDTRAMTWPTTVAVQTPSQRFVQEGLAAIHLYRIRTGTHSGRR